MGIPIQTPMGATGGAGIFTAIDNSVELGAIATALGTIAATISAQAALNEAKYWGTPALLIPGSPAASLGIIGQQLIDLNENLRDLRNKNVALNGTLSAISNGIAAQTQSINATNVLTSMAVTDQITNNAVVRNETYAALGRNGIQIQPLPNIPELLKQTLTVSTQFSISTNFLGSITSISNSLIQILINYLKTSFPVVWAQGALDRLWAALGINKLVQKIADADRTLAETAADLRNTAARGGTFVPVVAPPTPGV